MAILFGYESDELQGMNVDVLIPERVRGRHAAFRASFIANPTRREMGQGRDLIGRRRDGSELPIEVGLSPVTTKNGEFVVCVVRDVSLRRAAELQLRDMNVLLEQRVAERTAALQLANRDIEALSYSMAHDLRAPLRAIDGFAKLLKERLGTALDPESSRLLEVVTQRALKMNDMLSDYLRIIEVGRGALTPTEVDLRRLIHELWPAIRTRYPHEPRLQLDELGTVYADEMLLGIALAEVLDNAAKFTRDAVQPLVTVTTSSTNGSVSIRIEDNGRGFDPAHGGKLFGIFERLHTGTYDGNGAGLTLAKRAIDRHGGRLQVESTGSGGTDVTVDLPQERHEGSAQ